METMTWEEFASLPRTLHVRGELIFRRGPGQADIHQPFRYSSVGYILSHSRVFDSIRFFQLDVDRDTAAANPRIRCI